MKILNLYGGLGGNRKLWEDCEVTTVEISQPIADFYSELYPNDTVIIDDAHQYLLDHYKDGWDFIWSSPPCPTHSEIRRCGAYHGQYPPKYPDMKLYQEVIFLMYFADLKCKWIVENVNPYYEPLIPGKMIGRHLTWSNFPIQSIDIEDPRTVHNDITGNVEVYGISLPKDFPLRKDKILRNMVNPEIGLYILNLAKGIKYDKFEQLELDL